MSFVCLLFPRDLLTPILFVSMSATDVPVNFVAVLVTALSAAECTPSFTLPTSGTILDVKKKLCAQMIVSPWRQRLLLHAKKHKDDNISILIDPELIDLSISLPLNRAQVHLKLERRHQASPFSHGQPTGFLLNGPASKRIAQQPADRNHAAYSQWSARSTGSSLTRA